MNSDFFTANRTALMQHFVDGVIVLTAYDALQKQSDTAHVFEQESNLWYLSGVTRPGWRLVIDNAKDESVLIAPSISDTHRTFDGELSEENAKQISGVTRVVSAAEGQDLLRQLARSHTSVATLGPDPYEHHYSFTKNPAQARLRQELSELFDEVTDCRKELARRRAIKRPEEINRIRESVLLTCAAIDTMKSKLSSLEYEYQLEAELGYYFKRHGYTHGYEPIVAAGLNACTLHYIDNNAPIANGELVLLDVGAKCHGYSGDISRTVVRGEPTARQVEVHAAVETAHHEIISLLRPGYSIRSYLEEVDRIMKQAIKRIGLGDDEEQYRDYFPHAISHGLGVDIHDSLGGYETFEPGMVLTVEPGIYIAAEKIGVRIEDDIVITDGGIENLSAGLSTALR